MPQAMVVLILRRRAAPSRRPHPEEARSAVSKDEDGPLHAPSCFETHRSALGLWKHLRSRRAAMLLSMRAGERCAFWPNKPDDHFGQTKPNGSVGAADQPAAVRNERRPSVPVSGLFFTGNAATATCLAFSRAIRTVSPGADCSALHSG